ncbi:MAG: oligoendopeptidase F family protein [Chloroflexi bacterium]|nr:oligoendopeptidase F family protein [Chloroflexota bacterium]
MSTLTLPPRAEIPDQYKWDAESVFPDQAAWQAEFDAVLAALSQLDAYRGCLAESTDILISALELAQQLQKRMWIVYVYAALHHSVDTQDQNAAAMNGAVNGLMGRAAAATAFVDPELIALGETTLKQWMETDPRLVTYAHYFDNLFRKQKHVRSAEVEQVLGMLADPFSGAYMGHSMLNSADMRFKPAVGSDDSEYEVAQGTIYTLLDSPDRATRQTAWENYRDVYLDFRNTMASQLETSIKQNVFTMRARHFDNTLEMALDEQNLPSQVFHNLLANFKKNLPTWHRYWRLRQKALGIESLRTYDIWAPLRRETRALPFEEAVEWICAGLAPLGSAYVEIVRRACLQERWVDAMPNRGKREGAFSSGTPGTHPFIVMSYDNNMGALSTLAHELGHSMHSYLTWQKQPMIYTGYGMFVAEVASNFHQAMIRAYMLKEITDPTFRINILEEAMQNYHRYFFIMPTLARFELVTHERVGAPNAVQDYLGFLSAGSSKYPLDALRDAGVDMAQPEPVEAAFQVLASYVDQLEELVG